MADLQRFLSRTAFELPVEVLAADNPETELEVRPPSPVEAIAPLQNLDSLDAVIESVMTRFRRYDTAMDAEMCVELHRALPLSRRNAADRRMWAWLGVGRYSRFVAYRWQLRGSSGLRAIERFTGDRVRQTFARLWWAAELTRDPDGGYAVTRAMLALGGFQDVYEAMFGRAFCAYRPALAAFIKAVGAEDETTVRAVAREFSNVLTTLALECMSEAELVVLLKELVKGVRRS